MLGRCRGAGTLLGTAFWQGSRRAGCSVKGAPGVGWVRGDAFLLVQSYWEAGGSDLSRTAAARDIGTSGTPQRLRFFSFCGFCMNPSGSSPPFWQDGCWGTHQPQRFFGSRWDAVCTLAATKAWLLFGQDHHPGKARDILSI